MNPMPYRDALEDFSVGLAVTLKVQLCWADILNRTIVTKVVLPLAGFYPDFALPDVKGVTDVQQDYISDVCQTLVSMTRQAVISRDQRSMLEELLNDPSLLLAQSFADLDRWEHRTRRHLEELRKLSGQLEQSTELDLADTDPDVEGEEE